MTSHGENVMFYYIIHFEADSNALAKEHLPKKQNKQTNKTKQTNNNHQKPSYFTLKMYINTFQHCFGTSQQRSWTVVPQAGSKTTPDASGEEKETGLCQTSSQLDSRCVEEIVVSCRMNHTAISSSPHAH